MQTMLLRRTTKNDERGQNKMVEAMKSICIYVSEETKEAKRILGIPWRGLVLRGIEAASKNNNDGVIVMKEKLARMAEKLQTISTRCYKLENKE